MLLIPFLAVYSLFLICPFFRGIWISLHDWNLLAVAFNPDAKEFIGTRNYERVMWGRNITWGISTAPVLQGLGLVGVGLSVFFGRTGRLTGTTAWALGIASLLLFVLPGFHPGEGGRDQRDEGKDGGVRDERGGRHGGDGEVHGREGRQRRDARQGAGPQVHRQGAAGGVSDAVGARLPDASPWHSISH